MSSIPVNYPDPSIWEKTSIIQLCYGVWSNLSAIAIGMAFGFSAVAIPQLASAESLFVITRSDLSWIASILTLSSPFGCVLSGLIMDKFGRRPSLIACEVPMLIGAVYTSLADSARKIIIGRAITGIGVGLATAAPRVYAAEISLPNMRGVIGAFPNLLMSIGLFIQAGLGSFFSWQALCYFSAGFSACLMIINTLFLPESPYYLLMKDKMEKIRETLAKFRAADYNLDAELEEMKDFKQSNDIHKLSTRERIKALFTLSACKPFWIVMTFVIITQLAGVTVVSLWTVDMLNMTKSSVNSNLGNVLLAATRFVGGIICAILMYKMRRKNQSITSGCGCGLSFIVLCIYEETAKSTSVVPVVCYMIYVLFASIGYYSIPLLMMSELYPLQVRGILGGITVSLTNLTVFFCSKFYPDERDFFGFPYTLLVFGCFSLLGCIFVYFFLPETRGLTLQEIEEYFNQRRPTLTSQRRIQSMSVLPSVDPRRKLSVVSLSSQTSIKDSGATSKKN